MSFGKILWGLPVLIFAFGIAASFVRLDRIPEHEPDRPSVEAPLLAPPTFENLASLLGELESRPLFGVTASVASAEMAKPSVQPEETAQYSDPFAYRLVGVTKSSGKHRLHFIHTDSGARQTASFGDTLEGWQPVKITEQSAELTRGDERVRVDLFKPDPGP